MIDEFEQYAKKKAFLNKYVFGGLHDLNEGFDALLRLTKHVSVIIKAILIPNLFILFFVGKL
jgi:hypothetical protein